MKIRVRDITRDLRLQPRATIDPTLVGEYAEAMRDGAVFPPVLVFFDGKVRRLVDGFHRCEAALVAFGERAEIEAEERSGTYEDAFVYSLSANSTHGARRTNADIKRSVERALAMWPHRTDRQIAEICRVAHPTVMAHRARMAAEANGKVYQLETGETVSVEDLQTTERRGKDNRQRRLPERQPKAPVRTLRDADEGPADDVPEQPVEAEDEPALPPAPKDEDPMPEPRRARPERREPEVEYRQPSAVPPPRQPFVPVLFPGTAPADEPPDPRAAEDARAEADVQRLERMIDAFLDQHPRHAARLGQFLQGMMLRVNGEARRRGQL